MIDPVGIKAGMDHYDLLLLSGLQNENYSVELFSNFSMQEGPVNVYHQFFNTGVSKVSAITSNFFGFIKALRKSKKNHCDWIIVHVFRAGVFDLVTFTIARLMRVPREFASNFAEEKRSVPCAAHEASIQRP